MKQEEGREEQEDGIGALETDSETSNHRKQLLIFHLSQRLIHGDLHSRIEAAKDLRKLARKSSPKSRSNLGASSLIQPLVCMLLSPNLDAREASLLALLNLASRNERNKIKIVAAGAIPPLLELLKFQNLSLRELATAAILTLSAAKSNKPVILSAGATSLLVQILISGSVQAKVDAVTALYYLSSCTESENSSMMLDPRAVAPLIDLLKDCKKHSKFAEKTTSLLQIISNSEEGRIAISNSDGGILTLVQTVEDGSLVSTEHAVGVLLSMCQSCRATYREPILKEGAIPGLLRLTVEGTTEAQERARRLLDLLRDSPQEKRMSSADLERIVYKIAAEVDGIGQAAETAKRLMQEMVQRRLNTV
ncbi:U-box domain-containing protein 45 [Benincasa hispida]|uniref:U-box domain-containing protein 45 n=1 Tax=Benincasa hispida TaxID=102211 RepID=UPI001900D521|nr:U-box domain-containing protein 45 [Benincasa hispida]